MKKTKPRLASKALMGMVMTFYGKRYFRKNLKLIEDGSLRKIKPPYVLLANHASFADVGAIARMLYPKTAGSYVSSPIQRTHYGNILNLMGIIPKQQFQVTPSLVKDIKSVLDRGRPVIIYPEGKLSVDGTLNEIKVNTAKLIKMLKVPIVTVRFDGNYLHQPRWTKTRRKLAMKATVSVAVDAEQVKTMSVEEIHSKIVQNLTYDDYKYQRDNQIVIKSDKLTNGIEGIFFRCPTCNGEFTLAGKGNEIVCSRCGGKHVMDEYGVLHGHFESVPQWNKWQHRQIADEIRQEVPYLKLDCIVEQMVGNKWHNLGDATFEWNGGAITVTCANGKVFSYPSGMFYTTSYNNNYLNLPDVNGAVHVGFGKVGVPAKINVLVEEYARMEG
ncbi:MAG: 1-acyl-sn-glycerol-3-phosphate acyltransferase [Clostridia bacterium]|nr:1-acyl-sn-glycerol-3-phosphate acyltransferase [Clostridia bacterium]